MIEALQQRSQSFFEAVARTTGKKRYIDQLFSDIFQGVMKIFGGSLFGDRGSKRQWCERQVATGRCNLPNNQYCSAECSSGVGLASRCPAGFQPSHAWGYRVTGCWCDTVQGRSSICCDCTPVSNSPYQPSTADCGCMHVL